MSKQMLYRCPGPKRLHGVNCQTVVVDPELTESLVGEGWRCTPKEAFEAFSEKGSESKQEETQETEQLSIYEMYELGWDWSKITEKTGNKRPWITAKKEAGELGKPYPIERDGE